MDDAWKDWYNWRNGRWQGLEEAAQYVERIRCPLEPKQIAAMLRALIDIEEKLSVGQTPATWAENIQAAGMESRQG